MTPRATGRGFTLLEVLAAVLILGFFYTVLADQAVRALRSEGQDRRLAEAAVLADARLVDLETLVANGGPLEPLSDESQVGDYRVLVELLPEEDVDALLPPPLEPEDASPQAEPPQRLLVDERGQSRVYRMQVVVSWEEAGLPRQVVRTSWDFDRSELAFLFPSEGGSGAPGEAAAEDGEPNEGEESPRSGAGGRQTPGSQSGCEAVCKSAQTLEDLMRCLECTQ